MLETRFQAGGAIGITVENYLLRLEGSTPEAETPVAETPAEVAPKARRKPKADKESAGVASRGEDEPETT